MPGTREGGLKAAKTLKKKDPNHYRKAGAIGGAARGHKGFAVTKQTHPEKLEAAQSRGGKAKRKKR